MKLLSLAALALTCVSSLRAAVVIDFSPDTTGVAVIDASWTDSVGQSQIDADHFTLASSVFLTGGSIFSDPTNGSLGTPVRFLIYTNPSSAPIVDISTAVDAKDSVGTTTQSTLVRKHATIPSTFLAAGTYWFAMPSADTSNFTIGSGAYGDNSWVHGFTTNPLNSPATGLGDLFFQLEASPVPEPGSGALLAAGLGGLAFLVRRRFGRRSY